MRTGTNVGGNQPLVHKPYFSRGGSSGGTGLAYFARGTAIDTSRLQEVFFNFPARNAPFHFILRWGRRLLQFLYVGFEHVRFESRVGGCSRFVSVFPRKCRNSHLAGCHWVLFKVNRLPDSGQGMVLRRGVNSLAAL